MPMVGEALGPPARPGRLLREPRLVVHPGTESGRPVGAVAPGAVTPQPPVVGDEDGEDPAEAPTIGCIAIVLPLCPRHDVGPRARSVEALEAVSAVKGADLTANEPVGVLAGVEFIQGALEVVGAAAVAGEQQYERRVPHKQAVVEGRVDKAGDEAALRLGTPHIGERQLPHPPVAIHDVLVTLPEGSGQHIQRLFERGRCFLFAGHAHEGVLLDQRFPEMGVDVAIVRSQPADLLCRPVQHRASTIHAQTAGAAGTSPVAEPTRWRVRAGFAGWSARLRARLSDYPVRRRTTPPRPHRRLRAARSRAWSLPPPAGRSAYRRAPCP